MTKRNLSILVSLILPGSLLAAAESLDELTAEQKNSLLSFLQFYKEDPENVIYEVVHSNESYNDALVYLSPNAPRKIQDSCILDNISLVYENSSWHIAGTSYRYWPNIASCENLLMSDAIRLPYLIDSTSLNIILNSKELLITQSNNIDLHRDPRRFEESPTNCDFFRISMDELDSFGIVYTAIFANPCNIEVWFEMQENSVRVVQANIPAIEF